MSLSDRASRAGSAGHWLANQPYLLLSITALCWAGNAIDFEPVAGTDAKYAYAMILLEFSGAPEPAREMVKLTDRDGSWKIEVLPQLFPDQKKNPR